MTVKSNALNYLLNTSSNRIVSIIIRYHQMGMTIFCAPKDIIHFLEPHKREISP